MAEKGSAAQAVADVEVGTVAGVVRGVARNGAVVFRGVPYAASTAGSNRFRPPEPVAPWTGLREASAFGDSCAQPSSVGAVAPSVEPLMVGMLTGPQDTFGEDCLSVNIWTPAVDAERRPVMVWFHGGGHTIGSGNLAAYDGTKLARAGDVVVVTVNHRLGSLGYLALRDAPGGDAYPASGNAGLLDMVASLVWVRDNIAPFGGDPGNVTILGESGRGLKVSVLLGTPAAEGLFHRAIVQSGPALRVEDPEAAAATTVAIMVELGVSTVADLVAVPVDDLIAAQLAVLGSALGGASGSGRQLGPVLDGVVLKDHPFDPVAAPSAASVPLMVGTCRNEMTMFFNDLPAFNGATHEHAERMAPRLARGVPDLYPAYRKTRPEASPKDLLIAIATDVFRVGSIRLAERKVAGGTAPVWMYRCDLASRAAGGALGATHGIDLPLLWNDVDHPLLAGQPDAAELATIMTATWTRFARTGDPNNAAIPEWPPYTADDRATMLFDSTCAVASDPDAEERLAWRDYPFA